MTSHKARTMWEVSETVVIYTFLNFWNKFLVQIPWKGHFKSGKSSVLQARNRSFVRRGFRGKVPFSFQAQSCPRLFRTLPLTLLRQTAAYKYFQIFLKSCLQSLCVRNCRGIVFLTHPTVYPSHCLSKVCVSAKLHKLTAVVGNVLPFEAFFWHLLFGGSFPSFANLQPSA